MAENNKVVVHYLNGRILKGTTPDFFPNRPLFHLQTPSGDKTIEIVTKELKAVYFVRDFSGHPERRDVPGFLKGPAETTQGRKLVVRFKDGEILCGYSHAYAVGRDGFFLMPSDTGGNNLRVYVLSAATAEVQQGPAAEALAAKALKSRAA